MCTCELGDRWTQLHLPLHSSYLRPSTNTIRLHRRPRVHETIRGMKKELLLKNESDVKLRPDWFTSEATSLRILVGRAGSTIGNLPLASNLCVLFSVRFCSFNASILNNPLVSKLRRERKNYNTCENKHDVV